MVYITNVTFSGDKHEEDTENLRSRVGGYESPLENLAADCK